MLSTILAVIRSIALFPIMHLYLLCISIKAMRLTIVPNILTRSSYYYGYRNDNFLPNQNALYKTRVHVLQQFFAIQPPL